MVMVLLNLVTYRDLGLRGDCQRTVVVSGLMEVLERW